MWECKHRLKHTLVKHWPVLSIDTATRNWHRYNCLERISWMFSCPSTENPCNTTIALPVKTVSTKELKIGKSFDIGHNAVYCNMFYWLKHNPRPDLLNGGSITFSRNVALLRHLSQYNVSVNKQSLVSCLSVLAIKVI